MNQDCLMALQKLMSRNWPLTAALFAAAVAVVPLLFAADGEDVGEDSVAMRIEDMTPLERDRLRKNFDKYREMSKSKRRRYRSLHRELEQANDRDKLESVMENYYGWLLNDISRAQSEKLRQARDTATKLALVREFRDAQKNSPVGASERENMHAALRVLKMRHSNGLDKWMLRSHRHLKHDDYLAIVGIIENSLPLTPEESKELEPMTGARRHLRVINFALKERLPHTADRPYGWPSEELAQQIVDVISSPRRRAWLRRELTQRRNPMNLVRMLLPGVIAEWLHDVKDSEPSEEELDTVEKSLEDDQRVRLSQKSPEHRRRALRLFYYMGHHDPGFANDFAELWDQIRQLPSRDNGRRHRPDRHRRNRPPHDLRGDRRDSRDTAKRRRPPVPEDGVSFDGRRRPRDQDQRSGRSRE